jgi:hypothetical protein
MALKPVPEELNELATLIERIRQRCQELEIALDATACPRSG